MAETTVAVGIHALAIGSYTGAPELVGDAPDTDTGDGLNRSLGYNKPGVGTKEGYFLMDVVDLGSTGSVDWSTFKVEYLSDQGGFDGVLLISEFQVKANDNPTYDVSVEPLYDLAGVQGLGVESGQYIHVRWRALIDENAIPDVLATGLKIESAEVEATVNTEAGAGECEDLTPGFVDCSVPIEFPNVGPDGYQKLTDTEIIPTFPVFQIAGTVGLPLSILNEWGDDFGKRIFGGAKYVSIFENGGNETLPGTLIGTVNQSPIHLVGTFDVLQIDIQRTYECVVRLRSELNDPNYRDFIFKFRLITPEGVPTDLTILEDEDFPSWDEDTDPANPQHVIRLEDDDEFHWHKAPDASISEAFLRTGQGRVGLPVLSTPYTDPFPSDAKNHIFGLAQQGGGIFAIDFLAGKTASRIFYEVTPTLNSVSIDVVGVKRVNFTVPGFDNATVPANISVSVDRNTRTATLDFEGPIPPDTPDLKYETVTVSATYGTVSIDPVIVKHGGSVDISDIVDFDTVEYAPRLNYVDDTVWVLLVTDSKITAYRVPVVNDDIRVLARSDDPFLVPPSDAVQAKHIAIGTVNEYMEFFNLAIYTNPPEISDITLTCIDTAVSVNWATRAALEADLTKVGFGAGGNVDDLLDLDAEGLMPVSPGDDSKGWILTYDLDDGVSTEFVRQHIPANFGHQLTVQSSSAIDQADLIYATLDPAWPLLVIQQTALSLDELTVRGDLGSYTLLGSELSALSSGDVTIDVKYIVSRFHSVITLSYAITGGQMVTVHLPTHPEIILVSGDPSKVIDVVMTEDSLIFPAGSLSGKLDTTQPVTIIGDVGSVEIPAVIVEDTLLDVYWSGVIASHIYAPYVELEYTTTAPATTNRIRIPNRLGFQHKGFHQPFVEAPKGGWALNGLYARGLQARLPRAKILIGEQEIVFDTTYGGAILYDHIAVFNTRTGAFYNILENKLLPMQGGIRYQLGRAGLNIKKGDYMVVTFRHVTGVQGVGFYRIDDQFHDALRAEHLQGRF